MDLSVVIVNYNVRQFLEHALASIRRAMEGLEGEIFVVDNASDDGSVEMVRASFPDVCLIQNEENVGFARANNAALARARGRFLLLINPDTVVQEDTFHVMLKFFEGHPDAGLAGCKILNPNGSIQLPCRRSFPTPWVAFTKVFGLAALFPGSRLFGKYNLTYLSPDETYPVDAVSGSFMMFRREVYERIGGLDEGFFMYGEDLDWCYRVQQAGYKVYYVHSTQIIHFKGESTRRSEIDEVRIFYGAMQVFVEKHFASSGIVKLMLKVGILLRASIAWLGRMVQPLVLAAIDFLLVDCALLFSAYLYLGDLFLFPRSASPVVWFVPSLIVVLAISAAGGYTNHRHAIGRAGAAVLAGYIGISAAVYFAKSLGYSRAVVVISGLLSLLFIPGWRVIVRFAWRHGHHKVGRKSLFGSRTLIVGTGSSAQEVLRKLRARVDDGYDVRGFIALHNKEVGDKIAGLEVLGSIESAGKVIDEQRAGEVIFSTDGLSYTDILSIMARSRNRNVNFRLVPNSLEAILGKTRIDQLDTLPLIDIDYNIHRSSNLMLKRAFDLVLGSILFVVLFLPTWLVRATRRRKAYDGAATTILQLPRVIAGERSLVGLPDYDSPLGRRLAERYPGNHLGPYGLTGLVQINMRDDLEYEEMERYGLYYAKNQSLILDMEIILKSLFTLLKKKRR
ncbi:MAG: glycosyl transferase family 2 [Bacteroidetes bacterium]|nr:glycosyl transferase family 2 [Bacteroidota bacterium]